MQITDWEIMHFDKLLNWFFEGKVCTQTISQDFHCNWRTYKRCVTYIITHLPKRTISVSIFKKISGEGLTEPLPRPLPPISLGLTSSGSGFALDSRALRTLDRQIGPNFGTSAAYARS